MRLGLSQFCSMCQSLGSANFALSEQRHSFPRYGSSPNFQKEKEKATKSVNLGPSASATVYDAWLASRVIPRRPGAHLVPGTQRPFNRANIRLAYSISKECAFDLFRLIWALHPFRTTLMMTLSVVRSLFPAFRGYSQALIIDEIQTLVSSGLFTWSRLLHLVGTEILRRIVESLLDSFATANENVVHSSAKFFVEYQQMEQRVRLDLPTLADPTVRDLLQESDLFARSFNGMGGFGLLSPLDFFLILSHVTEIASHIWVIFTLTTGLPHVIALVLSVASAVLPLFVSYFGCGPSYPDHTYTPQEARDAQRQEKMRNLAYSDSHKPEVILFGLGPWILRTWVTTRKSMLDSELSPRSRGANSIFSHINLSEFTFALQNVPLILILQSSSTSLGSLALYRGSIQSVIFGVRNLLTTARMAFQGVFLMGAFCAAMKIKPRLQPKQEEVLAYRQTSRGLTIEARNLSYTYPGSKEPALKDVNLKLEAGETLAIVGYNGSGKSTLAKILLRIVDFDSGELLINGVDIRRFVPSDYHKHLTSVFQGFSKFNSTVKENVGVGFVEKIQSRVAVENAVRLAGADSIIESLPQGMKTKLDSTGFDFAPFSAIPDTPANIHHGLSGGEWQRIAISRAFMRANRPEVDLMLFDEPTSSLDAHAQNEVFNTIEKLSRSNTGERTKSVIFITHRLSTARRADKIAMMVNGTISEFGTHDELLRRRGSYAALHRASV